MFYCRRYTLCSISALFKWSTSFSCFKDLNFETYHLRSNVQYPVISTLSKNRVMIVHAWSVLEEITRYLKNMEIDNKDCVLQEHLSAMAPTVGKIMYSQELTVRAFQYFATSRSLYNRFRIDCQLPSIKTLTRIISKVSALNETCFIRSVFSTLKKRKKQCVIIQDEIYVKKYCYIMEELCLEERLMILNPL